MNPNQTPVGSQREFTDEALNKKFSYSFTRKQLIVLVNTLVPIQLPVGDMRSKVLREIIEEVQNTAIASITESDYVSLGNHVDATQPVPPVSEVQTN